MIRLGGMNMQFKTSHSFVLASASPRRKELFSVLNIPFEIITSNVDEKSVSFVSEEQYVRDVALLKTRSIVNETTNKVVVGADTIVAFEGRLLHKPQTKEEAIAHLQSLSGQTHHVYTAVVIIDEDRNETVLVEKTAVTFKVLSNPLIEAYVDTKDPFDKAGGYGIQTVGTLLVDKIEGDYNNVVGLPIASLTEHLLTLNYISI